MTQSGTPLRHSVRLVYELPRSRGAWELSEEKVPESRPHDRRAERARAVLVAGLARAGRNAVVARNLALRWDETQPAVGVDPDLCVLDPPPPDSDALESLRLWEPGHAPPELAIEIVSRSNARKDYGVAIDKYAASGTRELWVFDPARAGPRHGGGPFLLQLWLRDDDDDAFVRVAAGDGPLRSRYLRAWVHVVNEGDELAVADDEAGTRIWLTREESERAAKEAERAAKEAERAAKEAALARVAELEALLAVTRRREP